MGRTALAMFCVLAFWALPAWASDATGGQDDVSEPAGIVEEAAAPVAAEESSDETADEPVEESEAERKHRVRMGQLTALFLMVLILVLVLVMAVVLTLGRRLVFGRVGKLRPTELEDLWWKMNAEVGPFPRDAEKPPDSDGEEDGKGDEGQDEPDG